MLLLLSLSLLFCHGCTTDLTTGEENDMPDLPPTDTVNNAYARDALARVNALRAAGCTCGSQVMPPAPAVALHPALQRAAERHSADQAGRQQMSHRGSDGSRVGDRLTAAGYDWRSVGENVAWNQRSVEQVVTAWKNSPGHCRNIMNPDFRFMGLAVERWYWTQVLAR